MVPHLNSPETNPFLHKCCEVKWLEHLHSVKTFCIMVLNCYSIDYIIFNLHTGSLLLRLILNPHCMIFTHRQVLWNCCKIDAHSCKWQSRSVNNQRNYQKELQTYRRRLVCEILDQVCDSKSWVLTEQHNSDDLQPLREQNRGQPEVRRKSIDKYQETWLLIQKKFGKTLAGAPISVDVVPQ